MAWKWAPFGPLFAWNPCSCGHCGPIVTSLSKGTAHCISHCTPPWVDNWLMKIFLLVDKVELDLVKTVLPMVWLSCLWQTFNPSLAWKKATFQNKGWCWWWWLYSTAWMYGTAYCIVQHSTMQHCIVQHRAHWMVQEIVWCSTGFELWKMNWEGQQHSRN